jgi:glycosyltransferase involved in cell wall biosynthesis
LTNGRNLGLPLSLNRGLDACGGDYIARMDADDIAEPDRIDAQVRFLDEHPHIGIVGSARTVIDDTGQYRYVAPAVPDDLSIRWKCLLGNPFAHPTIMLRTKMGTGAILSNPRDRQELRYDPRFSTAQDYQLWVRVLALTEGANIERPLLRYRIRPGLSITRRPEQLANHDRIAFGAIRRFVPDFPITPDEIPQLRGRYGGMSVRDLELDPLDPHWRQRYGELLESFIAHHRADTTPFATHWRERIHALPHP